MENTFKEYFDYKPRGDLENFSKVPTETWLKIGEQKALENFQIVAKAVPAYRDFLRNNKVDPEKIRKIEDFKKLPLMTKGQYFKKYPLNMLVMGGDISNATAIHSSSGSTGKPLYWPKSSLTDLNTHKGVELMLTYYFDIDRVNTLLINCFSMGPWPAGEIVHTSAKIMGDKGLKISVLSPGTNTDLFFTVFNDISKNFDQVIISGYPSFLKDLIEEGLNRKINFSTKNIKILTGGEKFSENWRSFMNNTLKFKNPYKSVCSVLGTSETGVTSISTPFTDNLRALMSKKSKYREKFFTDDDLPSLTQYIPPARHIEIINEEIIVTCMGFVPLIRYNTTDYGRVLTPNEILDKTPISLQGKFKSGKGESKILNLPLLAVFGRSDSTIIIKGANIYPNQISHVLETPRLQKYLTGRFLAERLETKSGDSYVKLTLELKSKAVKRSGLETKIQGQIAQNLASINSEYSNALETSSSKALPQVSLKGYKEKDFEFKSGKSISVKI